MPERTACPSCGAQNYSTDRQCLSCGAALAAAVSAAPEAPPAAPALGPVLRPDVRKTYDDRSWWRRRTDEVMQYQLGALAGMALVCLGLAVLSGAASGQVGAAVATFVFFGIAAYCFVWYVRDPDSLWPLLVCILLSSLVGWVLIALAAFAGAAVERQLAARAA